MPLNEKIKHIEKITDDNMKLSNKIATLEADQKTIFHVLDEIKTDSKSIKDSQGIMALSMTRIESKLNNGITTTLSKVNTMCDTFKTKIELHEVEIKKIPFLQRVCYTIIGIPIVSSVIFGAIRLF